MDTKVVRADQSVREGAARTHKGEWTRIGNLKIGDWFQYDMHIYMITGNDALVKNCMKYCYDGALVSETCFGVLIRVKYIGKNPRKVFHKRRWERGSESSPD